MVNDVGRPVLFSSWPVLETSWSETDGTRGTWGMTGSQTDHDPGPTACTASPFWPAAGRQAGRKKILVGFYDQLIRGRAPLRRLVLGLVSDAGRPWTTSWSDRGDGRTRRGTTSWAQPVGHNQLGRTGEVLGRDGDDREASWSRRRKTRGEDRAVGRPVEEGSRPVGQGRGRSRGSGAVAAERSSPSWSGTDGTDGAVVGWVAPVRVGGQVHGARSSRLDQLVVSPTAGGTWDESEAVPGAGAVL